MRTIILTLLLLTSIGQSLSYAQTEEETPLTMQEILQDKDLQKKMLQDYVTRLNTFGHKIPQEEVFIHMDNTSYFLGDTIFYKAYVTRSDGKPGNLSGLLYVELLNHDGYLVERQKLKVEKGQAVGSIELLDTLYGGYYELRAYTRWQLNWGEFQHPHSKDAEDWFYSKKHAREYYRDYDKLYSRVFPVFDKPKKQGEYVEEMTLRPLRRYFKNDGKKPEARITFFPEGGNAVAGVPCNIAFDVQNENGEHLEGTLVVTDGNGNEVARAATENRGRGVLSFSAYPSKKLRYSFAASPTTNSEGTVIENTRNADGHMPEATSDGVALSASVQADGIHVSLHSGGQAALEELGVTVTCHGILKDYQQVASGQQQTVVIPSDRLQTGVVQITVFNALGRVYADRLVFYRSPDFKAQNVTFTGISSQAYPAFAPINLGVHGVAGSKLSLAVRDASHSEYIYDSGSILTELLLSSQIKGFVEAPEYYFESDDAEHRRALDLLLLVQGWRRYDWVTMATPKAFVMNHMPERTEKLVGEVLRYTAEEREDIYSNDGKDEDGMSADYDEFKCSQYGEFASIPMVRKWGSAKAAMFAAKVLKSELGIQPDDYNSENTDPRDSYVELRMTQSYATDRDERRKSAGISRTTGDVAANRFNENEGNLKHEVQVHAEFVLPGFHGQKADAAEGDMTTYNKGCFNIDAPGFYNSVVFFLAASDSTKWKKGKEHIWISDGEDKHYNIEYPEFYVKLSPIYPRFVKPYSPYQTRMRELPKGTSISSLDAGVRNLNEVVIRAKRSGQNGFDASKPAFVIDAYQAFNDVCDAGMCPGYYIGAARFVSDIARTYIGDMNMERAYDLEPRFNTRNGTYLLSPGIKQKYNYLTNLDMVYIYTDYSPRREGDVLFTQANQPVVTVDLRRFEDDSERKTYRDRRYILSGFNVCDDFYQPDYSKAPLPSTKDYRRTLYWNPNLELDADGNASVLFYNNGKSTNITISAEGLSADGYPQTGMSRPEER